MRERYTENKKFQLPIITECNIKAIIILAVLSRLGFIMELSWSLLEEGNSQDYRTGCILRLF